MTRYIYCLVRFVPEPRTGEFINVGAIAGNPTTGDWAVRHVSSDRRALKLGTADHLAAVHAFLARIEERLDLQLELASERLNGNGELSEEWLVTLHHDHRNIVQLTPPAPMVASDAESALDVLFRNFILDPVSRPRGYITKSGVLADLRDAYRSVDIGRELLRSNAEVLVGDRLRAPIDLAVANGVAHQLTQAWSFQRASVSEVTTQVKAWGYAISRLQQGDGARLLSDPDQVSEVPPNVDIQVAVAQPQSSEQDRAFLEAEQVFGALGASVHTIDNLQPIADRAAELVRDSGASTH